MANSPHEEARRATARSMRLHLRRWIMPASAFLAMPLLALIAVDDGSISGPVVQVEAVAVLAVLAYLTLRNRAVPDLSSVKLGTPVPVTPSEDDIGDAASFVARQYDQEAIGYFIRVLLDLPTYLSRVNEDVEVDGRRGLVMRTRLQYRLPASGSLKSKYVLLPLITAHKGELLDSLESRSCSDDMLSHLSQWETRGLLALAVRALFLTSLGQVKKPRLRATDAKVMREVITHAVCRVGNGNAGTAMSADAALAEIDGLSGDFPAASKARIKSACQVLSGSYTIVAEAPVGTGSNIAVSYSYYNQMQRHYNRGGERLRARRGLSPYTFDLPMSRVFQTDSYHLQLSAPPDQYIFSHHLERRGSDDVIRQEDWIHQGQTSYLRMYQERAKVVAHLYVRNQYNAHGSHPAPDVKSVIELRETPPGILGNTAMLSLILSVVILFVTIFRPGLNGVKNPIGGVPALLLALPAFIASAMGRGMDSKTVKCTSFAGYFGLHLVAFLSLASALLYVLDAATAQMPTRFTLRLILIHTSWHTDFSWLLLAVCSVALSLFTAWDRRNKVAYYLKTPTSIGR